MAQAFVPLVPGALRSAEPSGPTRLKPTSSAAQPLFQPSTSATLQKEPSALANGAHPHPTHGEPKITLERQGDTITHIRVQCGCGQVIELKCEY